MRKVLEVGCATGKFVKVLRRLGVEAFGVDLSSYVISKANVDVRTFLYNVDVETERVPFNNEFFDMIMAIETMEHFANITYALENLKQVLKVGGLMFITVPKPRPPAWRDITHVDLWTKDKWIEILL
ncbi:MAG: class I SAM-dependent methyltransferase [Candidatus Bathyarchaeia archaeon]